MKIMKKVLSLSLVLLMIAALGVSAFAATTTYTVTINDPVGTYEAYQIFAGDLSKDGIKLSNITWGTGVTEAAKTALGSAADYAETVTDANALAETFANNGYLSTTTSGTYDSGKITGLAAGYYLIKNTDGSVTGDNTYTDFIVEIVDDVTVSPKGDKPEVQKKVKDVNDSEANSTTDWQDSADYDIGDDVPFQLTGTLPTNYADYYSYNYIFHDTPSAGLTFNGDAKVYVVNGETRTEVTSSFTIAADGTSFACANLKAITGVAINADSKIIVEYTAELNENAVLGSAGNPNTVYLEYSNNPTYNGTGTPTTGNTPTDKVIVFTYKPVVNKIDSDKNALAGAAFALYKKNAASNEYELVKLNNATYDETTRKYTLVSADQTTFEWKGIDDGDYKIVEVITPDGYNTIDDQYFTVAAEHDVLADDPQLTSLTGNAADGSVITLTADAAAGTLTTAVVNNSGSILPSTGGMGTTMFYVIGSVLVLGAGVVLVSRKRMGAQA